MKNFQVLVILFLLCIQLSQAQTGLKLPEKDGELAKEKYVLLSDHFNNKEYDDAYNSLLWIMENAPDMHKSVYIIGQKTIQKLLDEDPSNISYKKSLMRAYDLRIANFGDEVKVLNRKAFDAYKYFRNDQNMLSEAINIFDKLYSQEKYGFKENLLYPYFDLKSIQRKDDLIGDEELIIAYQRISEIINYKLNAGESENLKKVQKLIDNKLSNAVSLDCNRIEYLFIDKNKEEKLSLQQAKLILKLSLAYDCTEAPYFIEAIKILFDHEPKVKLAKLIASYHLENKEYQEAIDYFRNSLELTQETNEKSKILFDIASVYSANGDKLSAREMAYQSLKLDPTNLNNYRLIGDMYYNSYDNCKIGKSRVKDRSVFYAAYEKYVLAKNQNKMRLAEQQFPSMETIHTENYKEGQVINTNCWIGENVKIKRRPSIASK